MSKFSQQFANASRQYDNGAPDDEPAFGLDDAATIVAADLFHSGSVGELVDTLADSLSMLLWVSFNVDNLPSLHRNAFRNLLALAEEMDKSRDKQYVNLNAPSEPEE